LSSTETKTKAVFPFVCDNCNFSTDDPEKWYKHLADVAHYETGHYSCRGCNHPTEAPKFKIKYGYDHKGKPNLVPEVKCKKCQDHDDQEVLKRLKSKESK